MAKIKVYSIANCLEVGIIEVEVSECKEHYIVNDGQGCVYSIPKDHIDIYTSIEPARISANARRLKEISNLKQQIERLEKLNF